jgi:hypothetical protein
VKDAELSGSAGPWWKVCTAGDALGDWLSFLLREESMRVAGDGVVRVPWDALQQLVLAEVRDECSFGDTARGLGYGFWRR